MWMAGVFACSLRTFHSYRKLTLEDVRTDFSPHALPTGMQTSVQRSEAFGTLWERKE